MSWPGVTCCRASGGAGRKAARERSRCARCARTDLCHATVHCRIPMRRRPGGPAWQAVRVNDDRDVLVLGAGVIGLTTAVRLAEAGFGVRVLAAGTGRATTSYAAGATWSPYLVEWTDRSRAWSFETLDELRRLAADPAAGFVSGWRFTAPVVSMPRYLAYLHDRATRAGAVVEERAVARLDLAATVVNCTGIGARELVPDEQLAAVRGQVVIVANPGVTEWFVGESDPPVYFFPHGDTVLLGGTAGHTRTGDDIRDRCAE